MHDISYDWLKLVEKALLKIQQLPALEEHFPFPWEAASQELQHALGLTHLNLSCLRSVWKGPQEFLQGMGEFPSIVAFEIAPIEGALFFVLPQADLIELTSNTLVLSENKEGFSGPKLRQGFYHFLLLKVLQTLDQLKIFKGVSLHLLPTTSLPQENGFCIDVACTLSSRTLQGRIICPQSFLSAFKAHQPLQKTTLLSLGESSYLELTLRCEVGHTSLSLEEWETLQVGDFLILDRCSFDPYEGKGSLTVSLGETPLFMARFKPEGIKVLDFAFYQEAISEPEVAEFEPSDIEIPEETQTNNSFHLTAEVGRLNISLHQLLQLQAGSLLELSMRPEQGIDVTRSGKRVAKAELIKLGDISGLRILDIER